MSAPSLPPIAAGARERDHARIERLIFVRARRARALRLAWRILKSEWTLGFVFALVYLVVASLMLNEAWSVAR